MPPHPATDPISPREELTRNLNRIYASYAATGLFKSLPELMDIIQGVGYQPGTHPLSTALERQFASDIQQWRMLAQQYGADIRTLQAGAAAPAAASATLPAPRASLESSITFDPLQIQEADARLAAQLGKPRQAKPSEGALPRPRPVVPPRENSLAPPSRPEVEEASFSEGTAHAGEEAAEGEAAEGGAAEEQLTAEEVESIKGHLHSLLYAAYYTAPARLGLAAPGNTEIQDVVAAYPLEALPQEVRAFILGLLAPLMLEAGITSITLSPSLSVLTQEGLRMQRIPGDDAEGVKIWWFQRQQISPWRPPEMGGAPRTEPTEG